MFIFLIKLKTFAGGGAQNLIWRKLTFTRTQVSFQEVSKNCYYATCPGMTLSSTHSGLLIPKTQNPQNASFSWVNSYWQKSIIEWSLLILYIILKRSMLHSWINSTSPVLVPCFSFNTRCQIVTKGTMGKYFCSKVKVSKDPWDEKLTVQQQIEASCLG